MRTLERTSQRTESRARPRVAGASSAPTSLTAVAATVSVINLAWVAPIVLGGFDLIGYKIERKIAAGAWATLVANTGTLTLTYQDTGLTQNTLHTYRVSAITEEETSTPSNEASDTTYFAVDMAVFDGTNDGGQRVGDLTGNANAKTGFIAGFFEIAGGDGAARHIFTATGGVFIVRMTTGNVLQINGTDGVATTLLNIASSAILAAAGTIHSFMAAWDLTDTAKRHLYIDNVSDLATVTAYVNGTIDYTQPTWAVGDNIAGTAKFNGALAQLMFHNTYLDLSIAANRAKVLRNLHPAYPGADGSLVLGVQPLIYLNLADGGTPASFLANLGSGGAFTEVGALTTAAFTPSP